MGSSVSKEKEAIQCISKVLASRHVEDPHGLLVNSFVSIMKITSEYELSKASFSVLSEAGLSRAQCFRILSWRPHPIHPVIL